MLSREIERITHQLASGVVAALREASVDELAELLPSVRKLVRELERVGARADTAAKPRRRSAGREGAKARGRLGAEVEVEVDETALRDAVIKLLRSSDDGLRSEEIQGELEVDGASIRPVLAQMVEEGRLRRTGQARGTRYHLAATSAPRSRGVSEASSRGVGGSAGAAPTRLLEVEVDEAVDDAEVSLDMINDVRSRLIDSAVPLTIGELEEETLIDRPALKQVLERMIDMGLVERDGFGSSLRFRLATAPPVLEPSGDLSSGARVVRRSSRSKRAQGADAASADDLEGHDEGLRRRPRVVAATASRAGTAARSRRARPAQRPTSGSLTRNTAPCGSASSTSIDPFMRATASAQNVSPSPWL